MVEKESTSETFVRMYQLKGVIYQKKEVLIRRLTKQNLILWSYISINWSGYNISIDVYVCDSVS